MIKISDTWECFLVGRTEPTDGVVIDTDRLGDIEIETVSRTYNETVVCLSEEMVNKIARYFKKKVEDLDDEDVAEYLVKVMDIEGEIKGYNHYFSRDW